MKILLLNGSPRKGNTVTALNTLKKGFAGMADVEIKQIDANEVSVSQCIACMSCGTESRCVFDDDTNDVISAIMEADAVVFATPVYWWGITAQLKLIIDKMYCQCSNLDKMKKNVGIIIIGEAEQDDPQYQIIPKQFECICGYMNWDIRFCKTYTAGDADALSKNEAALSEIEGLCGTLK